MEITGVPIGLLLQAVPIQQFQHRFGVVVKLIIYLLAANQVLIMSLHSMILIVTFTRSSR